jgi:hypothetical protein
MNQRCKLDLLDESRKMTMHYTLWWRDELLSGYLNRLGIGERDANADFLLFGIALERGNQAGFQCIFFGRCFWCDP